MTARGRLASTSQRPSRRCRRANPHRSRLRRARPAATALSPIRRVRRLKLLTAVLISAALGVALTVYAVGVSGAHRRYERESLDDLLERRVAEGSERVNTTADGDVTVGGPGGDALANGYPQLYVVELRQRNGPGVPRVVLEPAQPTWPDVDVAGAARAALSAGAPTTCTPVATRGSSGSGERLRLLASPVDGIGGGPWAVVIAVGNREPGERRHARLVTFMSWSAGLMLTIGVFVAVLVSRARWWVADQVLRRHEEFLRHTAHELRGPVTALRATTEAGLAGAEPVERTLERVNRLAQRTDEVIDDLVTMSRIDTGREPLHREPIRLDTLVETLVDARADQPPVEVATSPTVVVGNAELIRRAVDNLLDNAVRHGRVEDASARIVVTVEHGRVVVADRGPGIRPQILTHMIERAADGRRHVSGGLGITISSWVARLHGGQLEARDNAGGGAVFRLQLPELHYRPADPGTSSM